MPTKPTNKHHTKRCRLDTVRLRLAMPNHSYRGLIHATATIVNNEGVSALYRGLGPTLMGIAPYAALNFATYDLVKARYYAARRRGGGDSGESPIANLVLGGATGCFAATCCFPLVSSVAEFCRPDELSGDLAS